MRQPAKQGFPIRWKKLGWRAPIIVDCLPAGEAEAGSAGAQPAKE